MNARPFDVIVIGTGPGGEGAAMKCAKEGKRVCVVDERAEVGGACTHTATIPSKALRHAIQRLVEMRDVPGLRGAPSAQPSFGDLCRTAASVIGRQTGMRQTFYERNDVEIVEGHARFVDAHTVEVSQPKGATDILTAPHFVLAVGSRPYHPPDVDFNHPRIYDSDRILKMTDTPQSMIVYGAGVIGCEYPEHTEHAGVFASNHAGAVDDHRVQRAVLHRLDALGQLEVALDDRGEHAQGEEECLWPTARA